MAAMFVSSCQQFGAGLTATTTAIMYSNFNIILDFGIGLIVGSLRLAFYVAFAARKAPFNMNKIIRPYIIFSCGGGGHDCILKLFPNPSSVLNAPAICV
jgi:hypothetical protein